MQLNRLFTKNNLISIVWILFTSSLFASDPAIHGIVIDADTRDPLPFTNIMIAGQYRGTVSNADGYYILDKENLSPTDTIIFSYMGYKTLKIEVDKLQRKKKIQLHPATINLGAVSVSSRQLSVKQILALIKENFEKNYPAPSHKERIFYHNYEKVPFPDENQITVKKTNFVGLDKKSFNDLIDLMPDEFIDYQDAIVDLYRHKENNTLVPVEGISLMEESYEDIFKDFEDKLKILFDDINDSSKDSTIYYKFRSGVFSQKIENNGVNDSLWSEMENDPDNYTVETSDIKSGIMSLYRDWAHIESKNWDFINNQGKYRYKLERLTLYSDEIVYEISFIPKGRGLYEGTVFVSTTTFAILQMDYAYAEGKQNEKFQLLGIGHAMKFKEGRVIFEKKKSGYFVKYISAEKHEFASVDRNFSIMKKQKRFLTDKELNEIKIELNLVFDINSASELLVLNSEEISAAQFEKIKQPSMMKFRKEYAYTPEMWNNRTVLVPTTELQEITRK